MTVETKDEMMLKYLDMNTIEVLELYVERYLEDMDTKTLEQVASNMMMTELQETDFKEIVKNIKNYGWEDLLEEDDDELQ